MKRVSKKKQANREEWLKKLTDGSYKQGRGCLRKISNKSVKKFCCLGVLCDIVDSNGWDDGQGRHQGELGTPSLKVRDTVGLDSETISQLVTMNDGGSHKGIKYRKHSFADIRQYLRIIWRGEK